MPAGNVTLTARAIQKANTYTITYDANGGTVSPTKETTTDNEEITLPKPTHEALEFDGWYTAKNGGTKIGNAGSKYKVTESKTLYAHWVAVAYVSDAGQNSSNKALSYGNTTLTYKTSQSGAYGYIKIPKGYSVEYSRTIEGTMETEVVAVGSVSTPAGTQYIYGKEPSPKGVYAVYGNIQPANGEGSVSTSGNSGNYISGTKFTETEYFAFEVITGELSSLKIKDGNGNTIYMKITQVTDEDPSPLRDYITIPLGTYGDEGFEQCTLILLKKGKITNTEYNAATGETTTILEEQHNKGDKVHVKTGSNVRTLSMGPSAEDLPDGYTVMNGRVWYILNNNYHGGILGQYVGDWTENGSTIYTGTRYSVTFTAN